jgi:hypothetical protein
METPVSAEILSTLAAREVRSDSDNGFLTYKKSFVEAWY